MKAALEFLFYAFLWQAASWFITTIIIALYGSHYDPKDNIICNAKPEDQEIWRKQLEHDRTQARLLTNISMGGFTLFLFVMYWLCKH